MLSLALGKILNLTLPNNAPLAPMKLKPMITAVMPTNINFLVDPLAQYIGAEMKRAILASMPADLSFLDDLPSCFLVNNR